MSSISKACLELSNSIRGFRLSRSQTEPPSAAAGAPGQQGGCGGGPGGGGGSPAAATKDGSFSAVRSVSAGTVSVTSTITRAIKSATNRVKAFDRNGHMPPPAALTAAASSLPPPPPRRPSLPNVWLDERFLGRFFWYLTLSERCMLATVCRRWRDVLYAPRYWVGVTPVLNCKQWSKDEDGKRTFYGTLISRGFDSMCLFGATDSDVTDFVNTFAHTQQGVRCISLRCSNITDAGLDTLMDKMAVVYRLELSGCNDVTEAGLWACLNARLVSLSISDCINVADDSLGAIAQLLPSLYELNLQAYHVTDAALAFFSAKQSYTLCVLRLQSCWEITNHGIVNVIHSLPNLTVLSLSGCSKVTDDGVELIAENLRKLRSLDLSWCPRITDAALEYIACDLGQLEELILDRCSHVTDIGVGYLSTMTSLLRLFLRWCCQLRDFGLQHLYSMKSLNVLSLAGCTLLTGGGLTGLAQLRSLEELELTNCPGTTPDVCRYLKDNMPLCLIIE